jgi:hypothetical protein
MPVKWLVHLLSRPLRGKDKQIAARNRDPCDGS